ncbi:hypothetical protein AAFN75_01835 [Algibacter sp. AS12]|uniref:hypothetical protein n=1 Tax=Algibacter sp. AS12 TaxID=3135773 RepID=UPI00398AC5B2
MKHLIIIAALLISGLGTAQANYEKGMQKAFDLWAQNQPAEASNLFERIAHAEPDNWLPPYYAAQINILYSFGEKNEDVLTAKLKKAQNLINDATAISKDNPEILVLQALLHTVWVTFDGATYGMTLSGKVVELYTKAKLLDPRNPRAVYCKAEWDMGGAKYFGQDTTPFCKDLKHATELFVNFKPETTYHPNWGADRAKMLLDDCEK